MSYPAREFPNLPSFEESCDLWAADLERRLPVSRRYGLLGSILVGLLLMACLAPSAAPLAQGALGLTPLIIDLRAFGFLIGALMAWAPLAYLPLVFAQMPPRPTRARHAKTVALMRAYHAMKEAPCAD